MYPKHIISIWYKVLQEVLEYGELMWLT